MKNMLKLLVISFAFTALIHDANAASCQNPLSGAGSAKNNRALAGTRAKDNWRSQCRNINGSLSGFCLWVKSTPKTVACSSTGSVGNRTWNCSATSSPCN